MLNLNLKKELENITISAKTLDKIVNEITWWDGSLEDYMVYDMSELNEILSGYTPYEIISKVDTRYFDVDDEIFYYDNWGDLVSGSYSEHYEILVENSSEIIETLLTENWGNLNIDCIFETKEEKQLQKILEKHLSEYAC